MEARASGSSISPELMYGLGMVRGENGLDIHAVEDSKVLDAEWK